MERRQVFDLPEVTIKVIEHQLIERECGCGHRTKGAPPQGAEAPVQYGPRIAAIIVYLYIGQFLSKQRTAQALAELFGIPLSSGTVAGITARAAGGGLHGGLYGWTWGGCGYIDLLWVREDQRGTGLGSKLLTAAEQEIRGRGCDQVALSTHSFQAPGFYARFGYRECGRNPAYPRGHDQIQLVKHLS